MSTHAEWEKMMNELEEQLRILDITRIYAYLLTKNGIVESCTKVGENRFDLKVCFTHKDGEKAISYIRLSQRNGRIYES